MDENNEQVETDLVPGLFNTHLCTIASKLANKFKDDDTNAPFFDTLNEVIEDLVFVPITVDEVNNLIKGIETHKISAIEKITSKLLKDSLEVLVPQLTYLFNCSVTTSAFPEKWKIANVVLIYKGGSRNNVNNFRPISLLPTPGKLLEKAIHSRIYEHLEKNNILTDSQWGFRPERSTTLASTKLIDNILKYLNNKEHVGIIYVDIQKAFDMINHNILLTKLNNYGIRGPVLGWLTNYLTG